MKLHSPEHIPNVRWHPFVKSLLHAVFLFLLLWIGAGPVCPVVTPWDVMVYVAFNISYQ